MRSTRIARLGLCVAVCFGSSASLGAQQKSEGTKPANPVPAQEKPPAPEAQQLLEKLEQLRALLESQSRELQAQRSLLEQQQAKIEALERKTNAPAAPEPAQAEDVRLLEGQLEAVADSQKELGDRVAKVSTDLADAKRASDGKLRQLGNFTFSGDVRLRTETFNGGTLSTPRYRERLRLRFNVNARFNEEISGGFTLASGDLNEPISANQTLSGFYTRKAIGIDRGFLTYTPKWFKPAGNLSITGGKFAYTWHRTELTLDNDLNPEGVSPSISWEIKNPVLKSIGVVGYVLPFNESSSAFDSYMSGAQIQTGWQLGPRVRANAYVGFMDFLGADRIRPAQGNGALAGSSNTNAATATQFASKFGLLDTILRFDVKTPSARWPMMVQLEYVNNTRACTNRINISGTPPACNPRDRDGHWIEWQIGQTREKNDLNFGYTFIRIEREAVLATFNYSDLRAATNTVTHRLNFGWQAYRNVTLSWTGLFGRQLVTATSSPKEDTLRRMQFDMLYRF